jgi:hypothetical protein
MVILDVENFGNVAASVVSLEAASEPSDCLL